MNVLACDGQGCRRTTVDDQDSDGPWVAVKAGPNLADESTHRKLHLCNECFQKLWRLTFKVGGDTSVLTR